MIRLFAKICCNIYSNEQFLTVSVKHCLDFRVLLVVYYFAWWDNLDLFMAF